MDWVEIIETETITLWRDEPSAKGLTLRCTHGELQQGILALPTARTERERIFRRLHAEIRNKASGAIRAVDIHLSSTSPQSHGCLHTGNGIGDWIAVGDSIRIVGFDES